LRPRMIAYKHKALAYSKKKQLPWADAFKMIRTNHRRIYTC
jgi:hypothetical protein